MLLNIYFVIIKAIKRKVKFMKELIIDKQTINLYPRLTTKKTSSGIVFIYNSSNYYHSVLNSTSNKYTELNYYYGLMIREIIKIYLLNYCSFKKNRFKIHSRIPFNEKIINSSTNNPIWQMHFIFFICCTVSLFSN